MLKTLVNPLTPSYGKLKQDVLSTQFAWYWIKSSTPEMLVPEGHSDISNYNHVLLGRPDSRDGLHIVRHNSPYTDQAATVLLEILRKNQIEINLFTRICLNCVHPSGEVKRSVPHIDHDFDHTNLLIYLTPSDGDTVVEGERCQPEEDKVILFSGEHYLVTPTYGRRIVLVATFI